MNLTTARDEYLDSLRIRRLSDHSLRAYLTDLRAFESFLGEDCDASAVQCDQVAAFVRYLHDCGLASASIRRRCSGVRGLFRWLVDSGALAVDPWTGVTIPAKRGRSLPRNVPPPALRRIMRRLDAGVGVTADSSSFDAMATVLAIGLMACTGVRVAEVAAIRLLDIDIARHAVRIHGKGQRERIVYIADRWVLDVLSAYLVARSRRALDHDHLLVNRRLRPMSAAAVRGRLHGIARSAGVVDRITPHMFRHTAATLLVESGVDIRFVQRLLGHASLSTTEIYTHVTDRALHRALRRADILRHSRPR